MDLRKHAVSETGRLELVDASGEPLVDEHGKRAAIVGYGPGSKQYAQAQNIRTKRNMDRLRKKKIELTPEQQAHEDAEFLAMCTHSFENIEYDGLQGHDLYMAVYKDPLIGFVPEQFNQWLGDWANFSKGAPKN